MGDFEHFQIKGLAPAQSIMLRTDVSVKKAFLKIGNGQNIPECMRLGFCWNPTQQCLNGACCEYKRRH
jgi:hypothetical protein